MSSNGVSVNSPPSSRDCLNGSGDSADEHKIPDITSTAGERKDSLASDAGSDAPAEKATFGLSLSDWEGDSETASVCDDLGSTNSLNFAECDESVETNTGGGFKNPDRRLSAMLAISADEKIERQLAQKSSENDAVDAEPSGTETNTSFGVDREFEYLKEPAGPARRSASLRTGLPSLVKEVATGRPSLVKKFVRFADALGLELHTVHDIANSNEPPRIPLSAWQYLTRKDEKSSDENLSVPVQVCKLCFCFLQPCCSPDFARRVCERRVLLESCGVDDLRHKITGVVRVVNIAFNKNVVVRWTTNGWLTFNDIDASYLTGSGDGATDSFSFTICLPDHFGFGSRLEFSIKYETGEETFWDSNFGGNYRVECNMISESVEGAAKGQNKEDYPPFY